MDREQIKYALDCCIKAETFGDCEKLGCPAHTTQGCYYYLRTDEDYEGIIHIEMCKDALSLIKELTEEKDTWEAIAKSYQKQFEDCYDEKEKLTEENERLKNRLLIADEDIKRLRNRVTANIILTAKDAEKIKTECLKKIELDVKAIKAEAYREMQERFITELRKYGRMNYYIRKVLDQIAKEMLEGDDA